MCSDMDGNTDIFNFTIRYKTDSYTLNSQTIIISEVFVAIHSANMAF